MGKCWNGRGIFSIAQTLQRILQLIENDADGMFYSHAEIYDF
jgi:hypothetical protein